MKRRTKTHGFTTCVGRCEEVLKENSRILECQFSSWIPSFMEESTNVTTSDSNVFLFINRNVHGLVKTILKLLQIQAIQLGEDGNEAVRNLYGVRLVSRWFYLDTVIIFYLIFHWLSACVFLVLCF